MNTNNLKPAIIIESESSEQKEISIITDETGTSLPEKIPSKRFGITDLWNIRKKGKFVGINGKNL